MKDKAVILFTRIPIPGETKTRLYPYLSHCECAKLHEAFIKDIYNVLENTIADIYIYYTPDNEVTMLKNIIGSEGNYHSQTGSSLGKKMYIAITDVLNMGYKSVVLIGSDIPLLKTEDISTAFKILENNNIVISPTFDGGYYLIGMKEACLEAFFIEHYSTNSVFEETINMIRLAGKTYGIGTKQLDIDDSDDLKQFIEAINNDMDYSDKHTAIYLRRCQKVTK